MLRRSEESLKRDIEAGIFRVRSGNPMRRRGGDQGRQFEISERDLKEYAERKLGVKLGKPEVKLEELPPERRPLEGRFKECTSCGRLRPVSDYTRDARYRDGLSPICTTCLRGVYRR